MKITSETAKQVAALARLRLTPNEQKQYTAELGRILEYMEKLNTVDTKAVKPTYQVTGLANVLREDAVKPFPATDKILKNVPNTEGRQIKVPGVFKH